MDCASTEKDDFQESGSSSSGPHKDFPGRNSHHQPGGGNLGMDASSSNYNTQQEGGGGGNAPGGTTTSTATSSGHCPCGGVIRMLPSSTYSYNHHQQLLQKHEGDDDDHTILQEIITSHRHHLHSRNSTHMQTNLASEIDSYQVPNTFPEDPEDIDSDEPETWGRHRTESAMSVLTNNTDLETTYSTPTASSVFAALNLRILPYTNAVDSPTAPAACFHSLAPVSPHTIPQRSGAAPDTTDSVIPGIEGMSSRDLPSMSKYYSAERRAVREIPPYPHTASPQPCHSYSRSSSANSTSRSPIDPTELRRNYFSALEQHFDDESAEHQDTSSVPSALSQFKVSLSKSSAFSPIQRTAHTTDILLSPISAQGYSAGGSSGALPTPVHRSSSVAKKVSFSHEQTKLAGSGELGHYSEPLLSGPGK